ncbi:hypothetical protein, partial, partial [Parasitella parasitica]
GTSLSGFAAVNNDSVVHLAHEIGTLPHLGEISLDVSDNKTNIHHTFEVFSFYSEENVHVLLVSRHGFQTGPRLPDFIDDSIQPNAHFFGSDDERAPFLNSLQELLVQNSQIDMKNIACNLPDSVIKLNIVPGSVAWINLEWFVIFYWIVVFALCNIRVLKCDNGKLMPDSRKLTKIAQWPAIKTGRQLALFLGLMSYFRCSIPCYSRLTKDLDSLKQYKNLAAVWNESYSKANLKEALTMALSAMGVMLYQIVDDQICYVGLWETIFSYTLDTVHLPGNFTVIPDALSRLHEDDADVSARHLLGGRNYADGDELIKRKKKSSSKLKTASTSKIKMKYAPVHVTKVLQSDSDFDSKLLQVFSFSGWPSKQLTSDRGAEFVNQIIEAMMEVGGIDRRLVLAYNFLGNSTAENHIKLTKATTIKLLNDKRDQWEHYISWINYIIDTQAADHAKFAKKHKVVESAYPIGSRVMIKNVNRQNKLNERCERPYLIHNVTDSGNYTLIDKTGALLSRDIPIDQIVYNAAANPKPTSVDEFCKKHYEIQAVNDQRKPRQLFIQSALEGSDDPIEHTWKPVENFDSTKHIELYWGRRGGAKAKRKA